ncbi:hypothetical protein DAEQUDRAFT_766767 [Daedalea quercina L-15889]|uniref:Uncharacterized protein n=1 Tax=Daedalea quercina L-15889 TaxID=1314783 RepID=A0A165P646_9APHY|nr:hypothetical protein DAEQUDRAFT_766767 [Daedalea quercina L-15889]
MLAANGVYVRSLRGSIWQLGMLNEWPSAVPNLTMCRSIGPSSASGTLGSNGLYYKSPRENIWNIRASSNWVPAGVDEATVLRPGSPSDEDVHLRTNTFTAPTQPQPIMEENEDGLKGRGEVDILEVQTDAARNEAIEATHEPITGIPDEVIWNDNEVWETSSTADERAFIIGISAKRAAETAATMEDWETSTTIEEAEMIIGRPLRRTRMSGWRPSHSHANSESTASSVSIMTIAAASTGPTSARARVWANVVTTLRHRHYGDEEIVCAHL